jgi:hypothetical protein
MEEFLGGLPAVHRPRILFAMLKGLITGSPNVQGVAPIRIAVNVAGLLAALADLQLSEATEG